MSLPALVLAGARRGAEDPVARATGAPFKAMAPVGGRPMLERVLDALRASGVVNEIFVSLEADAPTPRATGWTRLEARETLSESVLDGLERAGAPLLVTTADHPLLDPATVRRFVEAARARGADVAAGVARRETAERAPGAPRRTYYRFADAEISGCNLFLLGSGRAREAVAFWRRAEALRKRPLALARSVGVVPLVRYAVGRLSLAAAERAMSRAAGAEVTLVELDDPFAPHDVDKLADFEFAEATFAARAARA